MSDISDLCQEVIETKLDRRLESHEGATYNSSARIFSADIYQALCAYFRISTLIIDEKESRMRFVTFIDADTKEDHPFYRGGLIRISIEMDKRTEIVRFLHEYGPLYKVSGTKKTQAMIAHAYERAWNGVRRAGLGLTALSMSFTFDAGYIDETALGVGTILVLTNLKNVKRYLGYRRKRG